MWKAHLEKIRKIEQSFGDDLNAGASLKKIEKLKKAAKKKFDYDLPGQYIEFLKATDGIEFNGFIIYGTDDKDNGFISQNKFWQENDIEGYIFFGTSSISWYVYEYKTKLFYDMDASETKYETFSCFDELADKILSDSLL